MEEGLDGGPGSLETGYSAGETREKPDKLGESPVFRAEC